LLWCALSFTACAELPREPVERAYYVDARKALNAESRLGWTVDRVEVAEAAEQAEPSACRVAPERRLALRRWVAEQIAARGGPSEPQYRHGVAIESLHEVLSLERTLSLLDHVELHVPADCPYWVQPDSKFQGVHATTRRYVLLAESVGWGSLALAGGKVRAGAGGAARLFAGYGFSTHWMAAAGFEAGGDATLQKESGGSNDGSLLPQGAFRFGIPAILRVTDLDRIYDLELAAVARLTEGKFTPWGARVAIAGGIAGLRRLGFMPSLQVWLAYEAYPAQGGFVMENIVRIGTRVGVDWHP